MSASLDDIYNVLKDCCEKLGTSGPAVPGTGVGGAPGTGVGGAPGAGVGGTGAGAGMGGIPTADEVGRMQELNDAYADHERKLSELAPGTKEYAKQVKEGQKIQKEMNKSIKDGTDGMGSYGNALTKSGKAMGHFKRAGGHLVGMLKTAVMQTLSLVDSLDEAEAKMRAQVGASKAMADNIGQAYDQLRIFGVTIAKAAAGTTTMYETMTDFSMASKDQQHNIVKTGLLLAEVGVDMGTYAGSIQHATKTMGMSAEEGAQMMMDLRVRAMELQMPIDEVVGSITSAGEETALLGRDAPGVFMELARVAKITGLEMNKLVEIAGKFDTFEGAADAAGSLNAMLGGNFVNSMDLMMAEDPVERFMMLRDALDSAGLSFESMGRFQKLAMADAMDIDVTTLGKAMSGQMDALQVGKTAATAAALEKDAFTLKSVHEVGKNMAKALQPSINALQNAMRDTFDASSDHLLARTKALNETMIKGTEHVMGTDFGKWIGIGLMFLNLLTGLFSSGLLAGLPAFLASVGSGLASVLGGIATAIFSATTGIVLLITGLVVAIAGGIRGVVAKWDDIKEAFSKRGILSALSEFSDAFFGGVVAIFGKIIAHIANFFGVGGPWTEMFIDGFSPDKFDAIITAYKEWSIKLGDSLIAFFPELIDFLADVDWGGIFVDPFITAGKALMAGLKDFFDISSPSLEMLREVGMPLLMGLLNPFDSFGNLLMIAVRKGFDLLPDFAKKLIMGGPMALISGAGEIDTAFAVDQAKSAIETATGRVGAAYGAMANSNERSADPYVVNLSMNLDGREVDKKVVNVMGGVARDAAFGD